MISVGVSGAAGRMGRAVAETVTTADDLTLAALYDPAGASRAAAGGVAVAADPQALRGCDVIVEFTRPDVVMENLATWRRFGSHAVVGTSGFDAKRLDVLRAAWPDGPPNCMVVANFSIGAVVMMAP